MYVYVYICINIIYYDVIDYSLVYVRSSSWVITSVDFKTILIKPFIQLK